ncbi:MAG: hypothetical protein QNL17_07140 [Synechococcus sp. ChSW.bin.154]
MDAAAKPSAKPNTEISASKGGLITIIDAKNLEKMSSSTNIKTPFQQFSKQN